MHMSRPGLKPTTEWKAVEGRAELVDSTSLKTIVLSEVEARLLAMWDGQATASQLAEAARAKGMVIEPRQAAVLLERLDRAGFLSTAPRVDQGTVPEPQGLERLSDVVPRLRNDLRIERAGTSGALAQVTDTLKNRSFTLYDFEVSIARLLDGRRTASDVIEAAAKIGIPVTLESLRKFVRQMHGYRFIEERSQPQAPAEEGTWQPRHDWPTEIREMYQSALRLARQGKKQEALEYLIALQQIKPDLDEVKRFKARLENDVVNAGSFEIDFDLLHGDSPVQPAPPAPSSPAPAPAPARAAPAPARSPPRAPRPSAPAALAEDPFHQFAPQAQLQPRHHDDHDPEPKTVPNTVPIAVRPSPVRPRPSPSQSTTAVTQLPPEPAPTVPAPPGTSGELFSLPDAPLPGVPLAGATGTELANQWLAGAPEPRTNTDPIPGLPETYSTPAPESEEKRRSVLPLLAGILGVGLVGLGFYLFWPVPRAHTLPCRLAPLTSVSVSSTGEGTVAWLEIPSGTHVEAQAPLGQLKTESLDKQASEVSAKLKGLEAKRTEYVRPPNAKQLLLAKRAFEKAKKPYESAVARRQRAEALPPARQRSQLPQFIKAEAKLKIRLDKARAALESLTHEEALAQLDAQKALLESELKTLDASRQEATWRASAAGWVHHHVQPGDAVKTGDVLAEIVDGRLSVQAQLTLPLPPGLPLEAVVALGAVELPVRNLRLTGGALQGEVDASKSESRDKSQGTLKLRAGEAPRVMLLLGR